MFSSDFLIVVSMHVGVSVCECLRGWVVFLFERYRGERQQCEGSKENNGRFKKKKITASRKKHPLHQLYDAGPVWQNWDHPCQARMPGIFPCMHRTETYFLLLRGFSSRRTLPCVDPPQFYLEDSIEKNRWVI